MALNDLIDRESLGIVGKSSGESVANLSTRGGWVARQVVDEVEHRENLCLSPPTAIVDSLDREGLGSIGKPSADGVEDVLGRAEWAARKVFHQDGHWDVTLLAGDFPRPNVGFARQFNLKEIHGVALIAVVRRVGTWEVVRHDGAARCRCGDLVVGDPRAVQLLDLDRVKLAVTKVCTHESPAIIKTYES